MEKTNLCVFKNVQTIVETMIRGKDFVRVSFTDRCFTIKGKTVNYRTGNEWDFVFNNDDLQ